MVTVLLAAGLSACATTVREEAVPAPLSERATVLGGVPNARYFADTQAGEMVKEAYAAVAREREHRGLTATDPLPPANFLAVSGGGDNGAYGAGLLVGWTERGDRPEFKLVTGVSTGALIAPFAFLGPRYDEVLRKSMIHYSGQNDIYRLQTTTARDGVDFNLAYIGRDFNVEHKTDFDQAFMQALFEYGRAEIRNGTAWRKSSPLLAPPGQPEAAAR
jgi:hypothetical protein